MSGFSLYLQLGFEHILDWAGMDHMLFIIALSAVYQWRQWKSVLILATAFTVGHSITLVLAGLSIISVSDELRAWVEMIIPITIIATAFFNIIQNPGYFKERNMKMVYAITVFFGLIHGMAYSSFFLDASASGFSKFMPILGFNLGIELGQVIIVGISVIAGFVMMNIFSVKQRDWCQVISAMIAGMALMLLMEKIIG